MYVAATGFYGSANWDYGPARAPIVTWAASGDVSCWLNKRIRRHFPATLLC